MRSSFGSGMGGGSGGGAGGMLRTVQRVVRSGAGGGSPEPFSARSATATDSRKMNYKNQSAHPNTALTLSSPGGGNDGGNCANNYGFPSFVNNLPLSGGPGAGAPGRICDSDWECVEYGIEDENMDHFVFGNVPNREEVKHAVDALKQALGPSTRFSNENNEVTDEVTGPMGFEKKISPVESELDWIEPSLNLYNSRMIRNHGSDRVYNAFHLLETEPSVQRMVTSLSSDKAIWDAVLNNDVVKELRGSINKGEIPDEGSDDDSNSMKNILSWVFVNTKEKITQLIDKITKLVNEVFQAPIDSKKGGISDPMEEKLRTSLFLSIIVLLIVVVTRAQSA